MELIIKPEKNIEEYINMGINTFLLPLEKYSVEYNKYFSLEEIRNIKEKYNNIDLFVSLNKNIMNEELNDLKDILKELDNLSIKGIFFYDSAIIKLKKDLNLNLDLVWSQTHMVTNYKTCDYYNSMGVKYALLSKEITKEEIIEIIDKSKISPIVELISKPSIGFSKRKLVTNYFENYNKEKEQLIEVNEKISDTDIIVSENSDGVVFIKDNILNGCLILDDLLNTNLEYVLLKEDFIDRDLFIKVVKEIKYYINNYSNMNENDKEKFLEIIKELIGENSGFFFQKTIYKVK